MIKRRGAEYVPFFPESGHAQTCTGLIGSVQPPPVVSPFAWREFPTFFYLVHDLADIVGRVQRGGVPLVG